jgi:LacI family transcriptional regulator
MPTPQIQDRFESVSILDRLRGVRVKRATIRDVAREAHVSVASVSRAFNGLSSITLETRDHVFAVAKRLGYIPHAGARSLSLSRTNVIGVVLPDLHGEFFSELVRGLDRATATRGYQMLFSTMHADPDLARQAIYAMHGRVDGLILMAPQFDHDELETLLALSTPVVLINSTAVAGRSALRVDNRGGVQALIGHMLEAGRRRFVHVTGPSDNIDAQERLAAFHDVLARLAPSSETVVVPGDFREQSGFDGIARLLANGDTFDAVFAGNDDMALGALRALKAAGRNVPEEVSVAGFDDVPLARLVGLSTVRVPLEELGDQAVVSLIGTLQGNEESVMHRLLLPELVIRETTVRSGV